MDSSPARSRNEKTSQEEPGPIRPGAALATDPVRAAELFREAAAEDVQWGNRQADQDASIITSGKTLKLGNSPWAHRGQPIEIDNLVGDDTRDELVSFIDHVRRGDVKTLCDVHEGLRDTATVLMANEAMDKGCSIEFPA